MQVSAAVALMGSPKADLALRLNGAVLAGALIDGGDTGARDFYDENGAAIGLGLSHTHCHTCSTLLSVLTFDC